MSLQNKMNESMKYIENKLTEDIDYNVLASYINVSEWEYRRLFSFLTQMPISEYIRRRRLTAALGDIQDGHKIVDVSQKYLYDSAAAFSRAFKHMHGMSPSKARTKGAVTNSYPPINFKLVMMEGYEMEENKRVIVGGRGDRYGISVDNDPKKIHETNENFWSHYGNDIIGCLALPLYGAFISEEKCQLMGSLEGKKVLDICCGSGESLLYTGKNKASELWGIDISSKQIEITQSLLSRNGYDCHLKCTPMEKACGLPEDYFDLVYSVYGIGWTTDLEGTFSKVASYLKKDGTFIFSWSHPIHKCVSVEYDALTFKKSYFDESWYALSLDGRVISLADRKLSTYINALARAGFVIEELVEESQEDLIKASDSVFSKKASMLPVTFVIKARKL
ncbi:helix-turn-helix domain-containing protein [Acidaminobacter sp. JC074]|uniref:helix-turn-helix domain-containing protein n=1 Tax=Acidaminobacter sp. JC074 TaxID=2530199 RepID=UPI001F0EAEB3|nr:helix-turn-helix domain-containing protein [Acidaminobacter sp. JC074]MCH4890079.1 helix-turn-helix domain-containing protein [Acidaminobacter sp. JC074]